MSGQMMDAAQAMHALYRQRAMQRISYARDLLKKGGFTFDKDKSIERSRRKTAAWPKDEAEMPAGLERHGGGTAPVRNPAP